MRSSSTPPEQNTGSAALNDDGADVVEHGDGRGDGLRVFEGEHVAVLGVVDVDPADPVVDPGADQSRPSVRRSSGTQSGLRRSLKAGNPPPARAPYSDSLHRHPVVADVLRLISRFTDPAGVGGAPGDLGRHLEGRVELVAGLDHAGHQAPVERGRRRRPRGR